MLPWKSEVIFDSNPTLKTILKAVVISVVISVLSAFLSPILGFVFLFLNFFKINPNYLFGAALIIGITIPGILVNLFLTRSLELKLRIVSLLIPLLLLPAFLFLATQILNNTTM